MKRKKLKKKNIGNNGIGNNKLLIELLTGQNAIKDYLKELMDKTNDIYKKQKNFYREQIPSNEENNYEITPEENDKDFNQYNQNKPYKQNQNAKKKEKIMGLS